MTGSVLEEYVATLVDPRGEPAVRQLDRVIRATEPELGTAIRYKILMYGLAGDFRTWVCAINSGRRQVSVNFLYGVMLDDPRKVLRAGSSVLMSWDFDLDAEIEAAALGPYVAEAVRLNPEYRSNRQAVQDAAYDDAEKAGRRPKPRP
ncbi:MAG: DUF1801 domain-containing protein [Chloroflexota bacterium]